MRLLRRLRSAAPLVLAAAVLALGWYATIRVVDQTSGAADKRRLADRLAVAHAFASAVNDLFSTAERQATALAEDAEPPNQGGVTADWIVLDATGRLLDTSASLSALTVPTGRTCAEPWRAIVAAVKEPIVVSRLVDINCREAVAVIARDRKVGVVFLRPAEIVAPLAVAVRIRQARITLIHLDQPKTKVARAAGFTLLPGADRVSSATDAQLALQQDATGPSVRRSGEGTARVVAAYAPIVRDWGLLLEQDSATFDVDAQERPPRLVVGAIVSAVFGIVLALLAVFEVRRRRAFRRSEDAKSEFFAIAGHELRTPLTSLRGFSETLALRWSDLDDERRRMLVERMVPQVRRMSRVIERMLLASSIRAQTHVHPRNEPLDVGPALEQAAERFRAEAPLHVFDVGVEPGLPRASADAGALDQVLDHLLDNAVKYSPAGGNVRLSAKRQRRRIVLTIEDEGVGLPSDRRRIFEPLVQGEEVDRRVHSEGGVGVGLFVVRTLVREMGGDVRAERRQPAGARFVVRLPLARATD